MNLLLIIAAASVYGLIRDSQIRESEYNEPLSKMPQNARDLAEEMIAVNVMEGTDSAERRAEIYKMLGEAVVLQRNFEMAKVREQLSPLGAVLSWFMKQTGLPYEVIHAKYEKEFGHDERQLFERIVDSASRSNPNLLKKFYDVLVKKYMRRSKL